MLPPTCAGLKDRKIGIALSGGGIRAAVFHLGVLRYLAEAQLLDKVTYISSVSGGSLLTGLILKKSGYKWPSNKKFSTEVYAAIRKTLLEKNIQLRYIVRLLMLPWNWLRFAFRANVLADTICSAWNIHETLETLPSCPIWAVNGTTMETGRRWRYKNESGSTGSAESDMGDGELGYTTATGFRLAHAMASSAAFPGGISPLRISTRSRTWKKPDYASPGHPLKEIKPKYCAYHVADGGIYDNLGLEPLFDISVGSIRNNTGCDFLVVSDAGATLKIRSWSPIAQLLGFSNRTIDVIYAQSRNLRVRGLVHYFKTNPHQGVLLRISEWAASAKERAVKNKIPGAADIEVSKFLSQSIVDRMAAYPTTLCKPSEKDFNDLERHGYEVAELQFALYS